MVEHYTISAFRLERVAELANVDEARVREYLLADWPEGDEHQAWLDNAPVEELADWFKAGADPEGFTDERRLEDEQRQLEADGTAEVNGAAHEKWLAELAAEAQTNRDRA